MLRLLPNIEGFGGIPGPEAYQIKNEYAQRRRLRRINSLPKVKFSRLERLYQTPKIKASLSKVQALKFILQIAASKLENCVFPNSNLQILSSKSNLRSSFANLFNFKFSKTCWKSPKLNKGILAHFEKMSLARWFWAFFFFWKKRVFCFVKWAKTNAFVFPIGKMKLINMLNLFQPIEFSLSKFDRLDPSYQTSKARIW